MTKRELKRMEKRLLKEKVRILKQKGFTGELLKKPQKEIAGDLSSYTTHPGDQGTDAAQREMASTLTSQENKLLREINIALLKIREGKYGICEKCGKPISRARLEALPYTRLCVKCKREEES